MDYAFIFRKDGAGKALRDRFDAFLEKARADGTVDGLQKKWFDTADLAEVEATDYRALSGVNGTVRLATIQNPPFSFILDDRITGYDIDLMTLFCEEAGYALELTDMNPDALIPAVQSGRFDAGCGGISITREREENLHFSEPSYIGGTVLAVRKTSASESAGFFRSIADSFEKTFIRENRWKLFLQGIGTTLLITVLSILFGTALGFLAFLGCRHGNRAANAAARFCVWLIHGMPVVVLLMILYYVVFGTLPVSGTVVSVIGFTLIFAAAVFSMLKAGVGAVDRGQTEAAYALGYTDRRTFFRVILPQAMPHFMPAYKAEITSLIKAMAVVGYVAVQALTKMGDIVRSRTFDAFFPLIVVAVIYFILAALLTWAVNRIEIRIDPRKRPPEKVLKGVKQA